jgi:hypothetical protein
MGDPAEVVLRERLPDPWSTRAIVAGVRVFYVTNEEQRCRARHTWTE